MNDKKKYLGIDFGGTWIRAALINGIKKRKPNLSRILTRNKREPESIVNDIIRLIKKFEYSYEAGISSVGIGIPTNENSGGGLDPCPNLPTMNNFPLCKELKKRLTIPFLLENDANCYAYGEWFYGKRQKPGPLVCITLGTSIGLGIIYKGEIFKGFSGKTGEIWRSPIDFSIDKNNPKNLETIVSGKSIEDKFQEITGKKLTGEDIYLLAKHGDREALVIFYEFGKYLSKAIRWVIDILDPEIIILGGSVSKSFKFFIKPLLESLGCKENLIVQAELGDLAPIYGAAQLAKNKLLEKSK